MKSFEHTTVEANGAKLHVAQGGQGNCGYTGDRERSNLKDWNPQQKSIVCSSIHVRRPDCSTASRPIGMFPRPSLKEILPKERQFRSGVEQKAVRYAADANFDSWASAGRNIGTRELLTPVRKPAGNCSAAIAGIEIAKRMVPSLAGISFLAFKNGARCVPISLIRDDLQPEHFPQPKGQAPVVLPDIFVLGPTFPIRPFGTWAFDSRWVVLGTAPRTAI
jgi:hypothetical protein